MESSSKKSPPHYSVLKNEIIDTAWRLLADVETPLLIDGTLGEAGHSLALRQKFEQATILSLDRDREMLGRAQSRIETAGFPHITVPAPPPLPAPPLKDSPTLNLLRAPFSELATYLRALNQKADLILLDLGVSIFHFRGAGRGFSYTDETLDMRLDEDLKQDAREVLNTLPEEELAHIFRELGEERFSGRIAREIVAARPLSGARELAEIITKATPGRARDRDSRQIHPATRVFQALRIYVNRELEELADALRELPELLAPGGLLLIISFHSLEDRLIKQRFRELGDKPPARPEKELPAYKQKKQAEKNKKAYWLLTPRPMVPTESEVAENAPSRSAKLRILQKKSESADNIREQ